MRQNCSYTSPPAARHYHPALSIWLSVDPMADKYPGVSPYTYCANNPVKLVDPDGREIGWIDDGQGIVFWDPNTNSEEEFKRNYMDKTGYSYVSESHNPSIYTLPNGDGQLLLSEWKEYETEDGKVGPAISLFFIPSQSNSSCGWVQTFSSNIPDIPDGYECEHLPLDHMEERFDFQTIDKNSTYDYWWKKAGPTLLEDMPTRCLNEKAQYSVKWMAQSSVIIDGRRSCTITWGFNITSENSTKYFPPRIIHSPSAFHNNVIKSL